MEAAGVLRAPGQPGSAGGQGAGRGYPSGGAMARAGPLQEGWAPGGTGAGHCWGVCPARSPALLILGSVCASCASVLPAE